MDYERILQGILDVGEEMVVSGAEVSRVEDSIYRMCRSYGGERINVFIITSNIQVTVEAPDGRIITQIRRIVRFCNNFDRLDYLNDLCRYICHKRPSPEIIQEKLIQILEKPEQKFWVRILGAALVGSGFAVFFGGSLMDGVAGAIEGLVIILLEKFLADREHNQIMYNLLVSVIAGFAALFLVQAGIGENTGKIMIGGIMILIPGIAMTNAVRDLLIGDVASGMLRLANAVLIAGAIACGFALSIMIYGGVL